MNMDARHINDAMTEFLKARAMHDAARSFVEKRDSGVLRRDAGE